MQLITALEELPAACAGGVAMCIGVFDGVHRGHQMLIDQARRQARRRALRSMVFTFHDHPLSLLAPPYAPLALTSPEEKAALIASHGLDLCAMIDFTPEFAALSAEAFLERVVAGACQARYLVCGEDFRFGQGGQGDVDMLLREAPRLGFELEVCEPLFDDHNPIRSSRIRQFLLEGRVAEANQLLGHRYTLSGVVVQGDQRGRTIGFPTANLEPPARRLVPHDGVYAVYADVDGQPYPAMMNIGMRPTFAKEHRSLEVHLLDFAGDLYGKSMRVTFLARIREERKFGSIQELIAQLEQDRENTRALFKAEEEDL